MDRVQLSFAFESMRGEKIFTSLSSWPLHITFRPTCCFSGNITNKYNLELIFFVKQPLTFFLLETASELVAGSGLVQSCAWRDTWPEGKFPAGELWRKLTSVTLSACLRKSSGKSRLLPLVYFSAFLNGWNDTGATSGFDSKCSCTGGLARGTKLV